MFQDFIYDIETYPNCFTLTVEHAELPIVWTFEISSFKNESWSIKEFLKKLKLSNCRMVGFNNLGFDYPILHAFYHMSYPSAEKLYNLAQAIIEGDDKEKNFRNYIKPSDRLVEQIDLFKIHHFDNNARRTSLKALEFHMKFENIEDLPFTLGKHLNQEEIRTLLRYNLHDVKCTKKFYHESLNELCFREDLQKTELGKKDVLNFSDSRIGKEFLITELEYTGVQCYTYSLKGREPKQTVRNKLILKDALLPLTFKNECFQKIYEYFSSQIITETKGVFKDLSVDFNNLIFEFGTGGVHASVEKAYYTSDTHTIVDIDVSSFYPNLAIVNNFYPTHLGTSFCKVYKKLYDLRSEEPKGTPKNLMLKLGLNSVYGDSNNPFSVFYDPLYTMKTTLNGQLLICKLVETLSSLSGIEIIQVNTDGVTIVYKKELLTNWKQECEKWEKETGLKLEIVFYDRIYIKDVNNYLAVTTENTIKRKGAYDYNKKWHQDASELIIPKVVEKVLLEKTPIRKTIESWDNIFDFMSLAKCPKSAHFLYDNRKLSNRHIRYIVSKNGKYLTRKYPPTAKNPNKDRNPIKVLDRKVEICNNLTPGMSFEIDYDYYVEEVEKLCLMF